MTPKRPKFSTQKPPDRFKTQLLSQVSQNFFEKSLSTSLNILSFHFLKVCVVCVKFIFLSSSLIFYWRIHCKPKKPKFFNLGPLCLPTPVALLIMLITHMYTNCFVLNCIKITFSQEIFMSCKIQYTYLWKPHVL